MKLVMASGCFDIIHYGHLEYLTAAADLGEWLVVVVTSDAHVNKGPGRPVFSVEKRVAMLKEFRCVDQVEVSDAPMPDQWIIRLRPQLYVKGREYEGRLLEQELVERCGGKVVFTDTVKFSSTALLGWI